jgi:hypothetical protein
VQHLRGYTVQFHEEVSTMERQEFEALQARLHKMERWMRIVVTGWVLSMAVMLVLGVAVRTAISQPEVVSVRALNILDEAGRRRITLDAVAGDPRIRILDSLGTPTIALGGVLTPGLLMTDSAKRSYVLLDAYGILFAGPPGQAGMKVDTQGPVFWFVDSSGRVFFRLP